MKPRRKRRRHWCGLNTSGTGDAVLLGHAVDADPKESDALGKLARYERSLERSLFRALDELRQLQDRRRNRPSPSIFDAVTAAAGDTE